MRAGAALCFALVAAPLGAQEIDPSPYRAAFDACLEQTGWQGARACLGGASALCAARIEGGETTLGRMSCAMMERDLWDAQLNAIYGAQIDHAGMLDVSTRRYGDASLAVLQDSLRAAQRAWIPFRDAQCALEAARWDGGSMRQLAGAECHLRMTAERAIYLDTATEIGAAE